MHFKEEFKCFAFIYNNFGFGGTPHGAKDRLLRVLGHQLGC